jgi:ABC-2 type transport system permease protein
VALVLLQLKLAIQRRSLGRSGGVQRAWYVFGWVLALVLGLGAGALVERMASADNELGELGLLLLLSLVFIGWVLAPILLPGVGDQAVDPEKLEQFPITVRDQVWGLLLGSMVAPTALFTFLVAAGATFATGESAGARFAIMVAALVFTVLCVAVSRSLTALLAGVLRSRRARDIMIVATGVIGLGVYLITRSASNLGNILVELENNTVEAVLSWLPPGAIGWGMLAVRDGDWGTAALHLLVSLVTIALAVWVWGWAIRRRAQGPSGGAARAGSKRRESSEGLAVIPLPLAWLPATATTAATAQQVRYFFFRQPRAMQSSLMLPIMGVVLAHSSIEEMGLTIGVAFFVVMATYASATDLFGYDDRGFTYLLSAGASMREVMRGKALATLLTVIPLAAVVAVVEAIINDLLAEAIPAVLGAVQVAVLAVGIGALISVWTPQNRARMVGQRGSAVLGMLAGFALIFATAGLLVFSWLLLEDVMPAIARVLVTAPFALLLGAAMLEFAAARLAANPWRMERKLVGS